jgi:hypothetical protein
MDRLFATRPDGERFTMRRILCDPPDTRKGLAAPVSLLLIVFSLTLVSTVAYNYALRQIDNRKEDLKLVAAEEKMLDLEEAITSTAWTPSGSRTLAFSNYGGRLRVETAANPLQVNVTLGASNSTVYDSNTGRFVYELPSTILGREGRWIRGDRRAIVNQSTAYQAQMSVSTGSEYKELVSRYRPLASSSVGGLSGSRRINNVRIYVVNLNASEALVSGGEFHVKVTCLNVSTSLNTFNGTASDTSMSVSVNLDGVALTLSVPISVGASGSLVRVEVVVSSMRIEGVAI